MHVCSSWRDGCTGVLRETYFGKLGRFVRTAARSARRESVVIAATAVSSSISIEFEQALTVTEEIAKFLRGAKHHRRIKLSSLYSLNDSLSRCGYNCFRIWRKRSFLISDFLSSDL